jgi:PAS domain S-box-containing protein
MIQAPIPTNEKDRLAALRQLAILDTDREQLYDRFTSLAARLFDMPIAQISLIDENRQWIKSSFGLEIKETERCTSFCGHTVATGDMVVVQDAQMDPRFHDNPFVKNRPKVRFYAGYPLRSADGRHVVGSLCVVDTRPRIFGEEDCRMLRDLGELVREEFRARAREVQIQAEERLNVLLTYSDSGFFDDNFEIGRCYFSPRWKELIGYADSELTNSYETFRGLIHPEDLNIVSTALTPYTPGMAPFSMEFRMRHKKGHWVWIESRGITSADHQMRAKRHIGFNLEVSERRRDGERLRLLDLCFKRISEGLMITDAELAPMNLIIVDANPAFERLTGYTREEMAGSHPRMLQGPFQDEPYFIHRLFSERRQLTFDGESRRKDGSVFHGAWTISPLTDAEGTLTHLLTSVQESPLAGGFAKKKGEQARSPSDRQATV